MARLALAEPFMISVERQEIYLRKLPPALDGFRIVHLSDLHYGPMVDPRHLQRAVQIANELRPDMIALTGDYISQERSYAAPCAEVVGELKAAYGVYAILGNHDHWTDAKLITDLFRAEGIRMLINQGVRIDARDENFWLPASTTQWSVSKISRCRWPAPATTNSNYCWLTIRRFCAARRAPMSIWF